MEDTGADPGDRCMDAGDLMGGEVVHAITLPSEGLGARNCSTRARKVPPVIVPSKTDRVRRPVARRPARTVVARR